MLNSKRSLRGEVPNWLCHFTECPVKFVIFAIFQMLHFDWNSQPDIHLHFQPDIQPDIQLHFSWISGFMPYYGLFSRDLYILDLQWRSPLYSLRFVDITPVCTTLMFMTHYDITMAHDVVRDAPLWHNNG